MASKKYYLTGYTPPEGVSDRDSVKQIQTSLGVSADGIWGPKTQAAYEAASKANQQNLDGVIVEDASPYDVAKTPYTLTQSQPQTQTAAGQLQYYQQNPYGSYTPSDSVNQAYQYLISMNQNAPGAYVSPYAGQIQSLLGQIQNRDPFEYDFNADPLYQQYKDQYMQGGKLAMMDTMAEAAGLTGGYASSYANTAGNQAYQMYLGQLNNVIPQLYDAAYGRYVDEGNALYDQMNLLQGLDSTEYSRYADSVSQYYNDISNAMSAYDMLYNQDYNNWLAGYDQYAAERDYWTEMALQEAAAKSSGSSGGSGGSKKKAADIPVVAEEDFGIDAYGLESPIGQSVMVAPTKQVPFEDVWDIATATINANNRLYNAEVGLPGYIGPYNPTRGMTGWTGVSLPSSNVSKTQAARSRTNTTTTEEQKKKQGKR